MNTQFDFRFQNQPFFNQSLNLTFSDKNDVIDYFKKFHAHYISFTKFFTPMSDKRMRGKFVAGYDKLHAHSVKLHDHYKLLLTIGTNGFDTWLNDFKTP